MTPLKVKLWPLKCNVVSRGPLQSCMGTSCGCSQTWGLRCPAASRLARVRRSCGDTWTWTSVPSPPQRTWAKTLAPTCSTSVTGSFLMVGPLLRSQVFVVCLNYLSNGGFLSTELAQEANPSDHPRASTLFLNKSQTDGLYFPESFFWLLLALSAPLTFYFLIPVREKRKSNYMNHVSDKSTVVEKHKSVITKNNIPNKNNLIFTGLKTWKIGFTCTKTHSRFHSHLLLLI